MNNTSRGWLLGLGLSAAASVFAASAEPSGSSSGPDMRGSYQVAGLFGESNEEKAERLQMMQHEQAQDSSIRYLRQRNDDLQNSVRNLTGQVEEQDHRITELNTRIDRMQKDFEYRLCKVVAAQLGTADEVPVPCMSAGVTGPAAESTAPAGPNTAEAPRAGGGPIPLTPPASAAAASASPDQSSALPSPNRTKFDAAMKLLAKTQYDEARTAFRSFADTYPKDELAPQAVYWFGDIAYVQKDYPAAARAFAEEIKKYPDSTRAPDSMLKLGQSLVAMGQKQEGCAALAALPTKYPDASQTLAARASDARKAAKCR